MREESRGGQNSFYYTYQTDSSCKGVHTWSKVNKLSCDPILLGRLGKDHTSLCNVINRQVLTNKTDSGFHTVFVFSTTRT